MENQGTSDWPWPEGLDALRAAPEHHRLLFENESVRVLDTRILPGGRTNIHTHRWPASLYVLSWSDFVRYDQDGKVVRRSADLGDPPPPGSALWSEPLAPHALENTGHAPLHVISVELKAPRPSPKA
jgi:hypothetical protein